MDLAHRSLSEPYFEQNSYQSSSAISPSKTLSDPNLVLQVDHSNPSPATEFSSTTTTSRTSYQIEPHEFIVNTNSVYINDRNRFGEIFDGEKGNVDGSITYPSSTIASSALTGSTISTGNNTAGSIPNGSTLSVKNLVEFYSSKSTPSTPIISSRRASIGESNIAEPINTLTRVYVNRTKKSRIHQNSEIARKYIDAAKTKLAETQRLLLEEKAAAEARLQSFRKSMEESKQRKHSSTSEPLYTEEEKLTGDVPMLTARTLEEDKATGSKAVNIVNRKLSKESTKSSTQASSKAPSRASSLRHNAEKISRVEKSRIRDPSQPVSEAASTRSVFTTRSRTSSISTTFSTEDVVRLEKERLVAKIAMAREKLAKQRGELMLQEQERKRLQAIKAIKDQQRAASRQAVQTSREKRLANESARIQRERRASLQLQIISRSPTLTINDQRWEKIVMDRMSASEASRKRTDEILEEFSSKKKSSDK